MQLNLQIIHSPAFLCTVCIFTFAKAASNSHEPNKCKILLHLGLPEAKGRRLSKDNRPGRYWGVGALDLLTIADEVLLPATMRYKPEYPNFVDETMSLTRFVEYVFFYRSDRLKILLIPQNGMQRL